MNKNFSRILIVVVYLLLFLFIISIVWINFHNCLWYDHDIYPDAYLGRLMSEQKTLFPDNWVFGNRLFTLGTPVLSAFFYTFVHNSILSLSLASTAMMILILVTFIWALNPILSKNEMGIGLLCIIGGVILGVRASSFIAGLQILYTMSSYYACYLIVLLFSVGVYFRIRNQQKRIGALIVLAFFLNFAIGIHSVREMLLLNIPLICLEGLEILKGIARRTPVPQVFYNERFKLGYVSALFILNIIGVIVSTRIPVQKAPIIETGFVSNVKGLLEKLIDSSLNVLNISGLTFLERGLVCFPLFISAICIVSIVVISLVTIIRNHDNGDLATWIKFCSISVFGVWLAGIFVLQARPLYYFIYYLLATLSITYLYQRTKDKTLSNYLCIAIIGISSISYICNFATDFIDYKKNSNKAQDYAEQLCQEGVECIYDVYDVKPVFASYSKDRIISGTIFIDLDMNNGFLFSSNSSLMTNEMQQDAYFGKALISMSSSHYQKIQNESSPDYLAAFNSKMELLRTIQIGSFDYMLFRPKAPVLGPPL